MNDNASHTRRPLLCSRWLWVVVLLLCALGYYGSYWRHGINFRDEGGTVTLLAKRLLDGEVPFRDVELGYNVGWFFPIVALFKVTGVSFVALRVYCFALSTLAAVLGFLTVERAGRHAGMKPLTALAIALAAGVMLIAVPGMTFKNYNPLATVANSWCLLGFVLARDTRSACWRALVGGLVLGATWLVRIDLGTFWSVLWTGVCLARIADRKIATTSRLTISGSGLAIVAAGVALMHTPVLLDAKQRGYYDQFTGAYSSQWRALALRAGAAKPAPSQTAAPKAEHPSPAATGKPAFKWSEETLGRTTWHDVSTANERSRSETLGLFLLTYFPLLTLIPFVTWAATRWFRSVFQGENTQTPLAALALLGGALTMFPQFFFWRPDSPHLSEFGPGYWTAVLGAGALLGIGKTWRAPARWLYIFLLLHASVWLWRMLPDRWCGTIAARANRSTLFVGENGVCIYEQKKTAMWMSEALRLIRENSKQGDFLVAYPYHPSFNVLSDRPTYERNVYVDNATAKPGWSEAAIQRIEKNKPAVIIVGDWDLNGTDASRFRNWAAAAYAHIREHYELLATFDDREKFEIYVRKP